MGGSVSMEPGEIGSFRFEYGPGRRHGHIVSCKIIESGGLVRLVEQYRHATILAWSLDYSVLYRHKQLHNDSNRDATFSFKASDAMLERMERTTINQVDLASILRLETVTIWGPAMISDRPCGVQTGLALSLSKFTTRDLCETRELHKRDPDRRHHYVESCAMGRRFTNWCSIYAEVESTLIMEDYPW
jgi:hypothetical protein